jgi:hypothetical protein
LIKENLFLQKYLDQAFSMIENLQGEPPTKKQKKAIIDKIDKQSKINDNEEYYDVDITSVPGKPSDYVKSSSLLKFTNWLVSDKPPVLSTYGTLFKRHEDAPNYSGGMLENLMKTRKFYKNKMFKYEKGTPEYIYNDIMQKLYKEQANSFYGALGAPTFHFYHLHLGPSVTYTGSNLTRTASSVIEGFIGSNFLFYSFSEIATFVSNCITYKTDEFDLSDVISSDEMPSHDDCLKRITDNLGFRMSLKQEDELKELIEGLEDEEVVSVFYRNNLWEFLKLEEIKELVGECFDESFLNYEEPPEDIKENIELFNDLLFAFVYYKPLLHDRLRRTLEDERNTILAADTDSTFVLVDTFFNYAKDLFPDKDFSTPESSIYTCNIITYVISSVIDDSMKLLTKHLNIPKDQRFWINMKNELTKQAPYRNIGKSL